MPLGILQFLTPIFIGVDQLGNVLSALFNYFLVPTLAFLVRMAAAVLDISLEVTVNMSQIINSMPVIDVIWKTIRDFASMGFIFMLLYASILMILGLDGGGRFKSLLLNIILCGVLVNFSLFFVKVGIDASNTLSLTIYNAIRPTQDVTMSEILAQSLQIQRPFNNVGQLKVSNPSSTAIIAGVGTMIMLTVVCFMFIAAAVMFLYRFIILILLLAFSPLPFVAMVIPQAGEFAKKFWDNLSSQLIVAPVYLGFLYVALKIITEGNLNKLQILNTIGTAAGGNILLEIFPAGMVLQYILVIIVMIAGLMAAQKSGGAGSKFALGALTDLGKWAQATVTKNTTKVVGGVANQAIGALGKAAGGAQDRFMASDKVQGIMKSFDNIPLAGGVIKNTIIANERGLRAKVKGLESTKLAGAESYSDYNKANKERLKDINLTAREVKLEDTLNKIIDHPKEGPPPLPEDLTAFKTAVSKMTSKDMEELGAKKFKNEVLASALSSKQIESLFKNDKLSDDDRDQIKDARAKGLVASLKNPASVMGTKSSDLESILKEEFTPEQKKRINDARVEGIKAIIESSADGARKLLEDDLKYESKDIAKLPAEILAMDAIAVRLDARALKEILEGKISGKARAEIRKTIETTYKINRDAASPRLKNAFEYLDGPAGKMF